MSQSIPRRPAAATADTTPVEATAAFFLTAFLDDHEGCDTGDCPHRAEEIDDAERLAEVFQRHLGDHGLVITRAGS